MEWQFIAAYVCHSLLENFGKKFTETLTDSYSLVTPFLGG